MAQINKVEVVDIAKNKLGLQPGIDPLPNQSSNFVQPVISMDVPYCEIARGGSTSSTTTTVYTTDANKDFYLTGAVLSLTKDAICDIANGKVQMNVTIGGATQNVLALSVLTLTAQDKSVGLSFSPPIKIDRNQAITITRASTTAGTIILAGVVTGYLS